MFKKRTVRKPANRNRRNEPSSEEDDDTNAVGTNAASHPNNDDDPSSRIQQIKKKRKLLTDLQYKRGVSTQELLVKDDELLELKRKHAESSKMAAKETEEEDNTEGLWEKKHKQAMEEYIQQKLGGSGNNGDAATDEASTSKGGPADEQELYRQLAMKAQQMAGKTEEEAVNATEGDTGTGGALLAGTGIAEVILPPTLPAPSSSTPARKNKPTSVLPTSWSSNLAVPSRFAQPANSRDTVSLPPEFIQERTAADGTNLPTTAVTVSSASTSTNNANDRVGFEAARRGTATFLHKSVTSKQQASDDKVFKQFVGHVREQQFKKK